MQQHLTAPTAASGLFGMSRATGLLAIATTVFHVVTARGYGVFRDELYYLACANHLDWGYVDHPPLVAVGAWFVRHVLGSSLYAVRLLPALAAGLLVILGAAMARQLGGRRFAELLTGVTISLAPIYLGLCSVYSMNAGDLLVWSALLVVLIHILKTGNGRLWLLFGAIAGVGLENKLSVLFLCAGVGVGLLVARRWRDLRDLNLWAGAGIAVLVFAPHVAWQIANGWPTLEFIRNAAETKNIAYAPAQFVSEQILLMNPITAPLWLTGLVALLFGKRFRLFRTVGLTYVVVLIIMLTQASKPYYLAPIYPVLFAAGAVVIERTRVMTRRRSLRVVAVLLVVVSGSLLAPLAKPLLPVDRYVAYAAALGMEPGTDERHEVGRLPQFFADMHGWRAMAEAVAEVYHALPDADRENVCIFAQNYGQAGAMEFFGPNLDLPPVVCGHNSYWLWGPGRCTGEVLILIGGTRARHLESFVEVTSAGHVDCDDCMPYEDDLTLWVARGLSAPIADAWPRVKHYQ